MGKIYIIPKVRLVIAEVERSLANALSNFLAHPTQLVLLIQGPSGMGKSACLGYIAEYTRKNTISTELIPLNLYMEKEVSDGRKRPISVELENIGWKKESREIRVLLLDGQDELKKRKGLVNIYQNNQLERWKNLKVIITCRQEILPLSYRHFFYSKEEEFVEWQLLPLDQKQQLKLVQQLIIDHPTKYPQLTPKKCEQFLENLPKDLRGNPLLLDFCLLSASLVLGETILNPFDQQINRYQIYEFALTKHFEREERKRALEGVNLEDNLNDCRLIYAQEIALNMWVNKSKTLTTIHWTLNLFPQASKLLALKTDTEKQQILLKEHQRCFLITKGEAKRKIYQFTHASIQEYLVASWLINYLKSENLRFDDLNQAFRFYKITPAILLSDEGVLSFLLDELMSPREKLLKTILNDMILATRHDKNLSLLGALAITLLNSAGENFSHREYQKINISGAILTNSLCYGTFFQESDLSGVDFQGADLTLANLENCQMKQIRFGEYPNYQFESADKYLFSSDLQRLLVGCRNGEVKVINLAKQQVENTYKIYQYEYWIEQLCWNVLEQIILVRFNNRTAFLIEEKSGLVFSLNADKDRQITALDLLVVHSKKFITIGYHDGFIQLLLFENGSFIPYSSQQIFIQKILFIALNQNFTLLFVCDFGKFAVCRFNSLDKKWFFVEKFIVSEEFVSFIQYLKEGKTFMTCSSKGVKLWDVDTRKLIRVFNESSNSRKTAIGYDHPIIAIGDEHGNLFLWNIYSSELLAQIGASDKEISALEFNTKDNIVACIDAWCKVTLHNFNQELKSKKMLSVNYCQGRKKVNFSPDGNFMISTINKTFYLQEINSWQVLKTYTLPGWECEIKCSAVSNQGNIIAIGSNIPQGDAFTIFTNKKNHWLSNKKNITAILITSDEHYLIGGHIEGNITAWNLKKEKTVWFTTLPAGIRVTDLVSCPRKKLVAVLSSHGHKSMIHLLNIDNGEIKESCEVDNRIKQVLISQSGDYILANGVNGYLYLWNYTLTLNAPDNLITSQVFLQEIAINNEATVIIGGAFFTIFIWQRDNKILHLKNEIIHPDKIAQVYLFETEEYLRITSRSETGSVRQWMADKIKDPYHFKLISENGHHRLSLKETNIDGVKELSQENLLLLQQRGAQGDPSSKINEQPDISYPKKKQLADTPLCVLYLTIYKFALTWQKSIAEIINNPIQFGLQNKGLNHHIIKAQQTQQSELYVINVVKKLSNSELSAFLDEKFNQEVHHFYGFCALHWCAIYDYSLIAQYLLTKGFEKQLQARNNMGLTPIQTAVIVGSHTFFMNRFERIPEFSELSIDNEHIKVSLNELHLALISGQIELVRGIFATLKKHHKKINCEVEGIGNLLHLLVYIGQAQSKKIKNEGEIKINTVDLLQFILQQDFSQERLINLLTEAANNYEKLSPLCLAAKYGQIGLVHALINYLKNYVEESNGLEEVNKAFYVAAAHGQNEVVELFIHFYHFKPSNLHSTYLETIERLKEKSKTEAHYQLILGLIKNTEKESAHHHYIAPQTNNQTYENLVFTGGGNGFIFSYALQALEWSFSQRSQSVVHDFMIESLSLKAIKRVAGSSVGALVAFALAIGCLPHELEELLTVALIGLLEEEELERMCLQLELTYPNIEEILAVATKELFEQINLLRKQVTSTIGIPSDSLQDTWISSQPSLVIYEKVKDIIIKLKQLDAELKGLSTGERAYKFLKQLLTRKGLAETLTFGELANLVSQDTQQHQSYKHLHIALTNLTQNMSEVLSSENGLYKNYIILDAIRASMAIPILFSPHHLRIKEGKQIKTLIDDYIDGSLLCPYLLDEFDFKQYTDTDYGGDPKYPVLNKSTLGICFKPQEPIRRENQSENLLSRFMEWVNLANQAVALTSAQVDKGCYRSIMLDTNNLPSVTLNPLTDQEKLGLKQQADKAVGNFFKVELPKVNNPVPKTSLRFFASANPSANPREGLKNEAKLSKVLQPYLPQGLALGKAYAQGDCFFDALAQCLNRMNNTDVNSDKYLRMLCHEYYGKNKALVDKLNAKDYGGIDKHDDYFMVQYTVDECNKDFGGRPPIWGRSYVEGIILCNQLNLRGACVIEILEHPETKQPIPSFHWVNQESYTSISEQEAKERLSNPEIPTLVVEQNSLHFVPLIIVNKALLSPAAALKKYLSEMGL